MLAHKYIGLDISLVHILWPLVIHCVGVGLFGFAWRPST